MTTTPMRHYTAQDFNRYFLTHWVDRVKWVLDPNMRKLNMRDPADIQKVLKDYDNFWLPSGTPHLESIPRHVWMLWQQGWDKAPPLVRRCAETWQEMNPGWSVHLLDESTISDYAPSYADLPKGKTKERTVRADLARICLLIENGGVWADATLFCARPLDSWVPNVAGTGLFLFAYPRPYRVLDNWFLISAQQKYTLRAMLDMYSQYWSYFDRAHIYLWMIYLFMYLARLDPIVKAEWDAVPKVNANGELVVFANAFDRAAPQIVHDLIDHALVPAHKLSHKWRFSGSLKGTPVGRLTGLQHL